MNSFRMIGILLAVLNFNWLFLKLNRFICNYLPVLPDHRTGYFPHSTGSSATNGRFSQWSRLKPSYEFHFEGLVQIQDVNPRIHNWNTKLILNLCMKYMVHVFSTMWRSKDEPSNSTSYSDNALHMLVLVAGRLYWGLQVTSSFCNLGLCFEEGLFWERYSLKGQIALEGHWRLHSWTLASPHSLLCMSLKCKITLGLPLRTMIPDKSPNGWIERWVDGWMDDCMVLRQG